MMFVMLLAAALGTGEKDYTDCLKVFALKHGATNTESIASILTIARGECVVFLHEIEKDDASDRNFKELTGHSLGMAKDDAIARAEGEAVKALLDARAKAKPTK